MKKKFLVAIIVSIFTTFLIGCNNIEKSNEANNGYIKNDTNENYNREGSDNLIRISKEEAIKINAEIVERLKCFYENNNIPYDLDNLYNDSVDVSRVTISGEKVERNGIDTKDMDMAEYVFYEDLNIDSYIELINESGVDLNNSIGEEYCEAITGEDVDFTEVINEINKYFNSSSTEYFRKKIEDDMFVI